MSAAPGSKRRQRSEPSARPTNMAPHQSCLTSPQVVRQRLLLLPLPRLEGGSSGPATPLAPRHPSRLLPREAVSAGFTEGLVPKGPSVPPPPLPRKLEQHWPQRHQGTDTGAPPRTEGLLLHHRRQAGTWGQSLLPATPACDSLRTAPQAALLASETKRPS